MPTLPTFPGVYVEELESGVRPINAVATSVAAFVGLTGRGLDHRPQRLLSFADFERHFGGLSHDSLVSYSVSHFFANGGTEAWVVRVPKSDSVAAAITMLDGVGAGANVALRLTALSRGAWANDVLVDVDHGVPAGDPKAFNLTITDIVSGVIESFPHVTLDNTRPNFVETVVNDDVNGSRLVSADATPASGRPAPTGTIGGAVSLAGLANDQNFRMRITIDVPTSTNVDITVIETGETLPTSLLGLCGLIERRINLELAAAMPGAQVRCTPHGDAIRLQPDFSPALLNGALDARLTPAALAPSALTMLNLTPAQTTVNVGHYRLGTGRVAAAQSAPTAGADGTTYPDAGDLIGSPAAFTGIFALDRVGAFNLLCIPDATRPDPANPRALLAGLTPNDVWSAALTYADRRRAVVLVDPPPTVGTIEAAVDWISTGLTVKGKNAAAYFPRLRASDPLDDFRPRLFGPAGAIAGLLARTDSERGVWQAPAGTGRQVRGATGLEYPLTDAENGILNPLGLNCLRTFPIHGTVAWGARTLDGADVTASQWKYLPVRRLALMIEEALYRGTQWAVFEPNDEPLWAQLRLNVTAFMQGLFRQGAFQGTTPAEAYLVKCDSTTTVQADIDRGIVNILVGFAPLKPAEFVFIKLQQLAGQAS
jgi:uncharacterized protein